MDVFWKPTKTKAVETIGRNEVGDFTNLDFWLRGFLLVIFPTKQKTYSFYGGPASGDVAIIQSLILGLVLTAFR